MIACFDAKYHYWFWRPYQAIPLADTDGNPATVADPSWLPLGTTPNFPEYPSAHACHSTAVVAALDAFFDTDNVAFTLDSRITETTREYSAAPRRRQGRRPRRASSSASTSGAPTCKARRSDARSATTSPTTTSNGRAEASFQHGRRPKDAASRSHSCQAMLIRSSRIARAASVVATAAADD